MNAEQLEPDPINRAVRQHLEHEASRVDASAMLHRVKAYSRSDLKFRLQKWGTIAAVGTCISACLAILFILGGGPEPRLATATEVLQQAQESHAAPTDRRYELTIEWEATPLRINKLEPLVRKSTIWTRGDQFRMESTNPFGEPVIWGQDKTGKIWIAISKKRGLIYEQHEVGDAFIRHAELMSLRVLSLLSELLQQFELNRKDTGKPGEPIRIEANLRPFPGQPPTLPRFRHVELELAPETKTIRKAVLKRMLNGEVINTMRFTLVETGNQPDGAYELRNQLDPDGIELDGKPLPNAIPGRPDPRAKFRDDFLKRWQSKFKP